MTPFVTSDYFDQPHFYMDSDGDQHALRTMNVFHMRGAVKKYRRYFPNEVKFLNHTVLINTMRRIYLLNYLAHRSRRV